MVTSSKFLLRINKVDSFFMTLHSTKEQLFIKFFIPIFHSNLLPENGVTAESYSFVPKLIFNLFFKYTIIFCNVPKAYLEPS